MRSDALREQRQQGKDLLFAQMLVEKGKKMRFTKMQGLGNDYLYVFGEVPENIKELSIKLSNRYFGPGADGMIYICKSDVADYKMRIFNADGSEALMCGNGIRCVGKYVYDKGYTDKEILKIDTQSGIKTLYLKFGETEDGRKTVKGVTVDMGKGVVSETGKLKVDLVTTPYEIIEDVIEEESDFETNNVMLSYTPVSTGNPHAVIFTKDMDQINLEKIGPQVEHHPNFPDGVNTEFVQVISETELRMRVWERGSGITMACGTGTCASVMAAVNKGYCPYDTPVTVHLDGGDLVIEIKKDHTIFMTGPAVFVYEGETEIEFPGK